MKIDRRQFIAGGLASLLVSPLLNRVAIAGTPAKKLIVILARGAWDVTHVFDPRPPGDPLVDGPWVQDEGEAQVESKERRPHRAEGLAATKRQPTYSSSGPGTSSGKLMERHAP